MMLSVKRKKVQTRLTLAQINRPLPIALVVSRAEIQNEISHSELPYIADDIVGLPPRTYASRRTHIP